MYILEYCFNNRSEVLEEFECKKIVIFYLACKKLLNQFKKVEKVNQVQYQYKAGFVTLESSAGFKRFLKHWNKVEKTAF